MKVKGKGLEAKNLSRSLLYPDLNPRVERSSDFQQVYFFYLPLTPCNEKSMNFAMRYLPSIAQQLGTKDGCTLRDAG
jgi:hypothetical protein